MNAKTFSDLSPEEQEHFMRCSTCGEWMDLRKLDEVIFHEMDHEPRSDVQCSGSAKLR